MEKKPSCHDCRFFWPNARRCSHAKSEGQNTIGEPTWKFASDMRDSETLCGWDAKLFEKPKPRDQAEFWWRMGWIALACALVTTCTYLTSN